VPHRCRSRDFPQVVGGIDVGPAGPSVAVGSDARREAESDRRRNVTGYQLDLGKGARCTAVPIVAVSGPEAGTPDATKDTITFPKSTKSRFLSLAQIVTPATITDDRRTERGNFPQLQCSAFMSLSKCVRNAQARSREHK